MGYLMKGRKNRKENEFMRESKKRAKSYAIFKKKSLFQQKLPKNFACPLS
jgi:hypothetical protein